MVFGSKISGTPTELEGWMMTFSSFNISPSTWDNMFEHGLNSSLHDYIRDWADLKRIFIRNF